MIDTHLLLRYRSLYGNTFTPALWAMRRDEAVNDLLRAAVAARCTPLTDAMIATAIGAALTPVRPHPLAM